MEQPIIDRWLDRKKVHSTKMKKTAKDIQYNRDRGERKKYQQELKGLQTGDKVKVTRKFQELNVGDEGIIGEIKPQPDLGGALFASVDINGMTLMAPLSYLVKVTEPSETITSSQKNYADKLRSKIDKEATTFDQANWSSPGRRPGGIYRSARKGQVERKNWLRDALDDAGEFIKEYADTMKQMIIEKGEASTDLGNDYDNGDSYIHENYTDKEYDLQEAAELLDQLRDHEETDSGLWGGQDPRAAISTQAAFTYSNAVVHYILEYIKEINRQASNIDFGPEDEGESPVYPEIDKVIYEVIGETIPEPTIPKEDTQGPDIPTLDKFGQRNDLQIKAIYDNEDQTADRYTIIFDEISNPEEGYYASLGVSDNPDSPNMGVSQWGDAVYPNPYLGKEIQFDDLPENVQKHVLRRVDQKTIEMENRIPVLDKFGVKNTRKKEGKMDLNKVIIDLWDRGVIGDKKVEALQRTANRRLVIAELKRIAIKNDLPEVLKVLASNLDGKVETKDRHGYPEGNREETTNQPSAEGKEQRLPGVQEPSEKGVSPVGREDRMPGVKEPAKTPWEGWKRKYEERENDIKDSKEPASSGGKDQRLPGNREDEFHPKGPYPGTHYGKKVDELNKCIKAQDFAGISRISNEIEQMKKSGQQRTPYEISKDQREKDRKIEGAPHEPKIDPSPQTKLGEPDSKINEQAHGKTKDSLDTKGEVNPSPSVDNVKGTPDKLGYPEGQTDFSKSIRGFFTGAPVLDENGNVKEGQVVEGETKEGQVKHWGYEDIGATIRSEVEQLYKDGGKDANEIQDIILTKYPDFPKLLLRRFIMNEGAPYDGGFKTGQKTEEDFSLKSEGEPKFEWSGIPGEQSQEPRTVKTTPELTEQKSTTVPGIGKGEDNQPPSKSVLSIKCTACKEDLVLSEEGYKEWITDGKTICRCGNLIEAELIKVDETMFTGKPIESEARDLTGRKVKARKKQVNWEVKY